MKIENKNNKDKLRYMRVLREMMKNTITVNMLRNPNYSVNLIGGTQKTHYTKPTSKGNFKPKYGVHKPDGLSMRAVLTPHNTFLEGFSYQKI